MKLMHAALMRAPQGWGNSIVITFESNRSSHGASNHVANSTSGTSCLVTTASRQRIHSTIRT
jgi:hypothetical protein